MGLAAGQARLLTITARKSNCEFQSMNYSHQKLAISRQLEDVSNNYQNSLNQTKLMYDYSGSSSGERDLTYDLLMTPSALNDYTPKLVTGTDGKVVLDSKYAAAAEAAGIPKEGLGTGSLPSEEQRNNFINALSAKGFISSTQSTNIQNVPYNQALGLGGTESVSSTSADITYQDLVKLLSNSNYSVDTSDSYYLSDSKQKGVHADDFRLYDGKTVISKNANSTKNNLTIGDILSGNYSAYVTASDGCNDYEEYFKNWMENLSCLDDMMTTFESILNTNDTAKAALTYARENAEALYKGIDNDTYKHTSHYHRHCWKLESELQSSLSNTTGDGSIGTYAVMSSKTNGGKYNSFVGINLSNFAKSYLTYFTQYMEGATKSTHYVGDKASTSEFADDVNYNVETETQVSAEDQKLAIFYDTLLNLICTNGWCENDNVNDKTYFQNMLKNSGMLLSAKNTDNYYYQENYATDSTIKTEEDTTAVAEAEAKYNADKQRLSNKEDTIDLQMKNLDTEISALTTEYDTVKSTIQKNIEKTFKRYSA